MKLNRVLVLKSHVALIKQPAHRAAPRLEKNTFRSRKNRRRECVTPDREISGSDIFNKGGISLGLIFLTFQFHLHRSSSCNSQLYSWHCLPLPLPHASFRITMTNGFVNVKGHTNVGYVFPGRKYLEAKHEGTQLFWN